MDEVYIHVYAFCKSFHLSWKILNGFNQAIFLNIKVKNPKIPSRAPGPAWELVKHYIFRLHYM